MLPSDQTPSGAKGLIGTLIGPRGRTQKLLEEETGCHISVRGKDSSKRIELFGPECDDDREPTYVLIRGPSQAAVEAAQKRLAVVIDFSEANHEVHMGMGMCMPVQP